MGMSIHYRGKLDSLLQVDLLVHELTDIAETMGWEYSTLDEDWSKPNTAAIELKKGKVNIGGHLPLKGVSIRMGEQGGSAPLYFDAEGYVRSPVVMTVIHAGDVAADEAWVSVKTQERSCEMHVAMVKLLRYLKKRYMSDLAVNDEGEYWDTDDEAALRKKMGFLADKADQIMSALEQADQPEDLSNLSDTGMADRIEEIIRRKLGRENDETA